MDYALSCNTLRCRNEVTDSALVTTCSHIFCPDCARGLGLADHGAPQGIVCPACNSQLGNPDEAVINNLNPSEEYKTSVLSGLSPNVILECAGRVLSFWAYQVTQDIYFQQYRYKTLAEKYSALNLRLEKTMNDANAEIESLQHKNNDLVAEFDNLRRKNDEYAQAYKDKHRKLLQTQELYEKVRRKAEMGQMQQAASDAVDSSLLAMQHSGTQDLQTGLSELERNDRPGSSMFNQSSRFDVIGMNSGLPRSNLPRPSNDNRWPQPSQLPRDGPMRGTAGLSRLPGLADVSSSSLENGLHQRAGHAGGILGANAHSVPSSIPAPLSNSSRRSLFANAPNFTHSRGGLNGVGLTSGLKVSHAPNLAGLEASVRPQ
ncbi:hypothetical protein S40288_07960 [Stachybotrys chartarum IBT 40288]|nr:hypothetical protein S40288_07960 [Stachybotrys chartarum IBT 40288]